MVQVSWIDKDIYLIRFGETEVEQLNQRADKNCAGSTFLARIVKAGLLLAQRVEDKGDKPEDKLE